MLPWNAYPWYVNAAPTRAQLVAGADPLRRLIELMPGLRVVLLLGKDAQAGWKLFGDRRGGPYGCGGIEVLATYHPSRGALQHPDPDERSRREDDIRTALRRAAELIRGDSSSAGVE